VLSPCSSQAAKFEPLARTTRGPGADRDQIVKAMAGHVLAKGKLVGVYEAPVAGG
jgi:phosphatidylethanolamine-binding protein (PEBP) family uncharacterized protein